MNKKFFILSTGVGGIIMISIIFAILNSTPSDETDVVLSGLDNRTGTPADFFLVEQRSKFCGTGNATSNNYVKEYKIPTNCTLPQAIVTDEFGYIWFVESNTGNVVKFDPVFESFEEFFNPEWPRGGHSMIYGIGYSPDGKIWFTDERNDSVWAFNILLTSYVKQPVPAVENSYPQKLEIYDSKVLINDFRGNRLVFLEYDDFEFLAPATPLGTDRDEFYEGRDLQPGFFRPGGVVSLYTIPSVNLENAVTGDFTFNNGTLWYTSWVLDGPGALYKVNQPKLDFDADEEEKLDFKLYPLPANLKTPNGITADHNGNVWLADSASSLFFKFDPTNKKFTQYVTSDPHKSTYGNYTGEIKFPVSRPYWIDTDSSGKLVFNEQGSNRIGVFDPNGESLVEYSIPSKNPNWGDCGDIQNCGISQVFDFVIKGDKIWFTEWAENNLGVVDTTIPLPIEIHLGDDEISLYPGESENLSFTISSTSENTLPPVSLILSDSSDFLDVQTNDSPLEIFSLDSFELINVILYADDESIPGKYKVLLGAETEQVSVSKFVTVIVLSPSYLAESGWESVTLDD